MKKIIVFGASGLVGSRFVEIFQFGKKSLTPNLSDVDLLDTNSLSAYIEKNNPDVVINFAAYTNVGEAEKQRGDKTGDCWKLNVLSTENLLKILSSQTHYIQISTDMVFPGSSDNPGPYFEDHKTEEDSNKLTWYGYSKRESERIVEENADKWTIVRLIYPVRAKFDKKLDFLRKPLKLFNEGKLYPMFNDQQISISFIDEIILALDKIIEGKKNGIFHIGSTDLTTPHELVSYLLKQSRGVEGVVKSASLKEFLKTTDNPVRYPEFGGLLVEKTERELGIKFSSWREIVDKLVSQGIET